MGMNGNRKTCPKIKFLHAALTLVIALKRQYARRCHPRNFLEALLSSVLMTNW
jgi:hypothetical protein